MVFSLWYAAFSGKQLRPMPNNSVDDATRRELRHQVHYIFYTQAVRSKQLSPWPTASQCHNVRHRWNCWFCDGVYYHASRVRSSLPWFTKVLIFPPIIASSRHGCNLLKPALSIGIHSTVPIGYSPRRASCDSGLARHRVLRVL